MEYSNFEITGKEPHEPSKEFSLIINARNETEAKKFVRWNFGLGKGYRLQAFKTNGDGQYFVNDNHRVRIN